MSGFLRLDAHKRFPRGCTPCVHTCCERCPHGAHTHSKSFCRQASRAAAQEGRAGIPPFLVFCLPSNIMSSFFTIPHSSRICWKATQTSYPYPTMLLWASIAVIFSEVIKHRMSGRRVQLYSSFPSHGNGVVPIRPEDAVENRFCWATQRENIHMSDLWSGYSKGQSLMEYALLFTLIAVVVIAILVYLGPQLASQYQIISNAL